ncbi:hypothetical protein C5167_035355 [Papaver somniferum]|uniref:Uncharacterized protein n=1 Tax=Papaver somniferum TaxID=3469 RepID=A0A4Y7KH35_PAPSO|nr:hypothetical protein C5167_035355 [Papaver somniferum]
MSRLIRKAYKSAASGLKYHTMDQRLLKSADNYEARYNKGGCTISSSYSLLIVFTKGELSKVAVDYKGSNRPKTLHEEPILSSMIRGYVLPSAAAATVGVLVAEIAYRKQLKEEYLGKLSSFSIPGAIERELSAESAN